MAMFLFALTLFSAEAPAQVAQEPIVLAQVVIEQRAIIRVRPAPAPPPNAAMPRARFEEKKGPSCIQIGQLAAALVASPDSIDLLLRGGSRIRAKLEKSCPAIDFYSGFYVKRSADGRICEDRDMIRARSGGECGITKFRLLVPAK
jgi:hypothetical protein